VADEEYVAVYVVNVACVVVLLTAVETVVVVVADTLLALFGIVIDV
jgi:hypothetical protein